MRLTDVDALIEDLEYDVELDARQLDDMDFVGMEREHVQFDKDCKQNCIDLLQHAPTIEERKTGAWIREEKHYKDSEQEYYYYEEHCSVCGARRKIGWAEANYCPNCGARMET